MAEPLFLNPVFHEKIWGGDHLRTMFNYPIPSDKTGECWGISGHPHGTTTIKNGPFAGKKLSELWATHPELFANKDTTQPFPLLVKILDANDDLSIQVHPDDAYAAVHEHELGKTECWYVLKADPGAKLFYGHHAQTREQLSQWVHNGDWQQLLRQIPVKQGDFVYVPSGTIHALSKGIVVVEVQQSSDSTYRLYDFDRVDVKTGQKRKLDLADAIATTTVPHVDPALSFKTQTVGQLQVTRFVDSPYFKVMKWHLENGDQAITQAQTVFTLFTVINGRGHLNTDGQDFPLTKGDHFILPSTTGDYQLIGDGLDLIVTTPGAQIK